MWPRKEAVTESQRLAKIPGTGLYVSQLFRALRRLTDRGVGVGEVGDPAEGLIPSCTLYLYTTRLETGVVDYSLLGNDPYDPSRDRPKRTSYNSGMVHGRASLAVAPGAKLWHSMGKPW